MKSLTLVLGLTAALFLSACASQKPPMATCSGGSCKAPAKYSKK